MYITTYTADAQSPPDTRHLLQQYDNSSLMSKCKHQLMDSTAMKKQSSPACWKTTSLASRLNVTAKVVEENVEKQTFIRFSWWDDHNIWHRICPRTWDSVCYDGVSLLSSCIILNLVCRKWQCVRENLGSGSLLCKIIQCSRKQKQWHPDLRHLKNNEFQSALWNLSLCREF